MDVGGLGGGSGRLERLEGAHLGVVAEGLAGSPLPVGLRPGRRDGGVGVLLGPLVLDIIQH